MIKYKIDVMKELSNKGYTSSKIRRGENINTSTLNILCVLLKCQPSDIIEVIPTDAEKIEYY